MKPHGGFEHNLQSLRVVDLLEQRYAEFDGLNLTFETREGILKHCSAADARRAGRVTGSGSSRSGSPSLEAHSPIRRRDRLQQPRRRRRAALRLARSGGAVRGERSSSAIAGGAGLIRDSPDGARARTVRHMIDTLVTDLNRAGRSKRAERRSVEEVRSVSAHRVQRPGRRSSRVEALPATKALPALPCRTHE